jgi:hypothetical protein
MREMVLGTASQGENNPPPGETYVELGPEERAGTRALGARRNTPSLAGRGGGPYRPEDEGCRAKRRVAARA